MGSDVTGNNGHVFDHIDEPNKVNLIVHETQYNALAFYGENLGKFKSKTLN